MIIWIASYPRSGNTFLRVVLKSAFGLETYSIYDDTSGIAKDAATTEIVGHKMLPADFDLEEARSSEERYIIKTHDHVQNPDDRVIYLVRDGRECAVSYLNYVRSFRDENCNIEDVLYGNVKFGSWGEHLKSWNPQNTENTLLLKFEDFTASPQSFLKELSDFLEVEEQARQIPGFEKLHEINPEFFRTGRFDSWTEDLTSDEVLTFWLLNYPQMLGFYPEETPPEPLAETPHASRFSELFSKHGHYFKEVVNDLEIHRKSLVDEKDTLKAHRDALLKHRDDLLKHRDALIIHRDDLLKQKTRLENQNGILEKSLRSIKSATSELTDVKAWKAPIRKYQAYKKLLQIVFQHSI